MLTVTKKLAAAIRRYCREQLEFRVTEFDVGFRNRQGDDGAGVSANCLLDGDDSDLDDLVPLEDMVGQQIPLENGVAEIDVYAGTESGLAGNVTVVLLWDGTFVPADTVFGDRRAVDRYQAEYCKHGRR